MSFKYNYIVFGADGYFLAGYHDILKMPNVLYLQDCCFGIKNWFTRLIVRLNFSEKVNRIIKTPFSKWVYPKLFPYSFGDNKPVCYLFFVNWFYLYNSSYIDYLKKKDPRAKFVVYFQDLVPDNGRVDIYRLKARMDLVLSYDRGECAKYGLSFYPTPMSRINSIDENNIKRSDFYFCGRAKTRYSTIVSLYQYLSSRGYRCDFNLVDMNSDDKVVPGIHYLTQPMDYFENLSHVCGTRCIVEIMQEGADGYTPRMWESIIYNKHFLTNNKSIQESGVYNKLYMHHVDNLKSDRVENWICSNVLYEDEVINQLSPVHLLEHIEKAL